MDSTEIIFAEYLKGNKKSLSRAISIVENEIPGYWEILTSLGSRRCVVIGITGPPGAGKSTLLDAVITVLRSRGKKVGVIAVDPSSAFTNGSLLGDRIRMSRHFLDEEVFIRSLSSRSALGGLSFKTQEVSDLMAAFDFDYVFIETVGVGQSEIQIAGLADFVILILIPESGDEIQNIKSGILEIGDLYVVNKADRPGSSSMLTSLQEMVKERKPEGIVLKTQAITGEGVEELIAQMVQFPHFNNPERSYRRAKLKILSIIQHNKLRNLDLEILEQHLRKTWLEADFNIYKFAESYL